MNTFSGTSTVHLRGWFYLAVRGYLAGPLRVGAENCRAEYAAEPRFLAVRLAWSVF